MFSRKSSSRINVSVGLVCSAAACKQRHNGVKTRLGVCGESSGMAVPVGQALRRWFRHRTRVLSDGLAALLRRTFLAIPTAIRLLSGFCSSGFAQISLNN